MSDLAVAAALGLTVASGWSALSGVTSSISRPERFAWALAGGLLIQGLVLVAATGLGAKPTRAVFLAADLAVVGAGFLLRRGRRPLPESGGLRAEVGVAARVLLAAALLGWLVFAIEAISEPMWSTDFLAIWGMKGKVIYLTGRIPERLFRDPALYWAHREYPLLVPFSLASLASLAGEWNDRALGLLFGACALGTWLSIYGFLARRLSVTAGAIGAVLTGLCFRLYNPVNAGTAETVFALGAVLAASAFLDVARENAASASTSRWRLAAAALFCAATKQEGTLWVYLLGVLWLVSVKRGFRQWASADRRTLAAFALPPALHWIALYLLRGNATRRDFDFSLFEPARWAEWGGSFVHVVSRIATKEAMEAAAALAAIAVYLAVTRRGFADGILAAIAAQILFYCVAFSVSSFDPMYAVDGAFRRIALTLFPAAALALAARWPGSTPGWTQRSSAPG
jgi:hypothetical protein